MVDAATDALLGEIENAQRLVKTDAYQLSIGEIVNMYRDKELIINPDFQRLFRWEIEQKSRLIESILLGIPIPSIFVFENSESKWELIDGLQRISTLLEFIGVLRDPETGGLVPPSVLEATKYLPSLSNVVWENFNGNADFPAEVQSALTSSLQLAIRRSRIGVEILKRPSSNSTKYELFQRLNAGGTPANAQELRNCVIIMVNPNYSQFVRALADNQDFRTVLSASDDQIEKQRHMEYVCRYLVHTYYPYGKKMDVEEFIDEGIINLATTGEVAVTGATFEGTFRILNEAFGSNALRRQVNGQPQGKVSLAAFECLAVGIGMNYLRISALDDPTAYVVRKVQEFWNLPEVDQFYSLGQRGTTRIQKTIPFGQHWFAN